MNKIAAQKNENLAQTEEKSAQTLVLVPTLATQEPSTVSLNLSDVEWPAYASQWMKYTCKNGIEAFHKEIHDELLCSAKKARGCVDVNIVMDCPRIWGAYSDEDNLRDAMKFAIATTKKACSKIGNISCSVAFEDPHGYFAKSGIKLDDYIPSRPEGNKLVVETFGRPRI